VRLCNVAEESKKIVFLSLIITKKKHHIFVVFFYVLNFCTTIKHRCVTPLYGIPL
jgi:hypothetical protein